MPHLDDVRQEAVLLADDSIGVSTEGSPRKIQANGEAFYSTISPSWLDQLNIAEQSAETLHSLSLGMRPVIIKQPAVIIQPAELVREEKSDAGPHGSTGVASPW